MDDYLATPIIVCKFGLCMVTLAQPTKPKIMLEMMRVSSMIFQSERLLFFWSPRLEFWFKYHFFHISQEGFKLSGIWGLQIHGPWAWEIHLKNFQNVISTKHEIVK